MRKKKFMLKNLEKIFTLVNHHIFTIYKLLLLAELALLHVYLVSRISTLWSTTGPAALVPIFVEPATVFFTTSWVTTTGFTVLLESLLLWYFIANCYFLLNLRKTYFLTSASPCANLHRSPSLQSPLIKLLHNEVL